MTKADLHVHSKYSNYPSEWALRRIGMQESYTEVEEVYALAKKRGMDFVTITDHDSIEGAVILHELHPEDTFIGVEVTTYFPEDHCAIHLLVHDITEKQFAVIDRIRNDIYELRAYIQEQNIAHSVAHATYAVNGKLSMEVLEKLILLFDVFEGINGARNPHYNAIWHQTLINLTPAHIEKLQKQYHIKPMSDDPWIKGLTGGSDDHAGLLIAETYTTSDADTRDGFIRTLKDKKTHCSGRSNDFKSMVYVFGKIVHDFVQHGEKSPGRLWKSLSGVIFDHKRIGFKNWLKIQKLKRSRKATDQALGRFAESLQQGFCGQQHISHEQKVDLLFQSVSQLLDDYTCSNLEQLGNSLNEGHVIKLVSSISRMVSTAFLTVPYLGTFKNLHLNSHLIQDLRRKYVGPYKDKERNVLWFSDTVADLNGVSVTVRNFAQRLKNKPYNVKLVTSLPEENLPKDLPKNTINLPSIGEYTPEFYRNYTMRFPSFLKSLDLILKENPTEIIISTPGPVGLLGMFVARMLGIKSKGIYHSDFGMMMQYDVGGRIPKILHAYENWFYQRVDEIKVPTKELIRRLELRGLGETPMSVFRRGIDTEKFKANPQGRDIIQNKYSLPDGFTMIYVGRVSKDKSVDFLVDVYKELRHKKHKVNLIIAGNGPAFHDIKQSVGDDPHVVLTGRIERDELIDLYSASDLLVFPSTIDTFGMAVLEAQSCGVPAVVTDVGGPQEVILDETTGFVLEAHNKDAWVNKIESLMDSQSNDLAKYQTMQTQARQMVESRYSWEAAIQDLLEQQEPPSQQPSLKST